VPYIRFVIKSLKNRELKRYWTKADVSGLRPDWSAKVRRILLALDAAEAPEALDVPGFGFHAFRGSLAGRYAVTVSRNWRITFAFEDGEAIDVDLEDYHGS
jgi:proteic killer suppression protein